jgi:hypothetical protein
MLWLTEKNLYEFVEHRKLLNVNTELKDYCMFSRTYIVKILVIRLYVSFIACNKYQQSYFFPNHENYFVILLTTMFLSIQ